MKGNGIRLDGGGERGTRSSMNVCVMNGLCNRANVEPPTVIWNTEKAPERKTWGVTPMRKCQVEILDGSPGECLDPRDTKGGSTSIWTFVGERAWTQSLARIRREKRTVPRTKLSGTLPSDDHTEDEPAKEMRDSRLEGRPREA